MKILHSLTSYPPSTGGAQFHMHQLACELKNQHELIVVSQWNQNRTDWLLGTTIKSISKSSSYVINEIPVTQIGFAFQEKLKMVPWVLSYPIFQGIAVDKISDVFLKEFNKTVKEIDIVHNCRIGREFISFASYKYAKQKDIPFIITPVHHPAWSGWFHRLYHQLYRKSDAVIALTESEKKILTSLGVQESKIHVTGHGPILSKDFDSKRFKNKYKMADVSIVLFLGQKYEYKGLWQLLNSTKLIWEKFPDVHFLFIGPRTQYSIKLFAEYHDSRILELDTVSLQEKTDALAACNVLCVPSTQESFGGVYTEAWSMGKPVIGCNIPAVSEVIDHGVNGLLVSQSAESIADGIIQILSSSEFANEMGLSGKNKVQTNYSWNQLAKKTNDIYLSLK
jgi:glycosyltransferase involved in cell wall biosynthesis